MLNYCRQCEKSLADRWSSTEFCSACAYKRTIAVHLRYARQYPFVGRASKKTQAAVRRGILEHPSTLKCVDCGKQASCYDHRYYSKPLKVEPVCGSCNKLRGKSKDFDRLASQTKHLTWPSISLYLAAMPQMADQYRKLVEASRRREARVLKLRAEGKTLQAIGDIFDVEPQRIFQIIKVARKRLQKQPA